MSEPSDYGLNGPGLGNMTRSFYPKRGSVPDQAVPGDESVAATYDGAGADPDICPTCGSEDPRVMLIQNVDSLHGVATRCNDTFHQSDTQSEVSADADTAGDERSPVPEP